MPLGRPKTQGLAELKWSRNPASQLIWAACLGFSATAARMVALHLPAPYAPPATNSSRASLPQNIEHVESLLEYWQQWRLHLRELFQEAQVSAGLS